MIKLANAGSGFARLGAWIGRRLEEPSTYAGVAAILVALDQGKMASELTQISAVLPVVLGALGVGLVSATTTPHAPVVVPVPVTDGAMPTAEKVAAAVIAALPDIIGRPAPPVVAEIAAEAPVVLDQIAPAAPVVAAPPLAPVTL
jgi:hypothetical protein